MYTDAADSTPKPSPGPAGACPECRAPLHDDQRYCLECGAAAQEPPAESAETVSFAPIPVALGPPPSAAPPSSPPPHLLGGASSGSDGSNASGSATTVLAAVGVLLLAIGVGVLIGRTGSGGSANTSGAPQVITLSAPTTSTTATETSSTNSGSHKKHGKTSGSSNEVGASEEHPAPPSVVKKLNEKGGGSYEQKSNNLPNVISTG